MFHSFRFSIFAVFFFRISGRLQEQRGSLCRCKVYLGAGSSGGTRKIHWFIITFTIEFAVFGYPAFRVKSRHRMVKEQIPSRCPFISPYINIGNIRQWCPQVLAWFPHFQAILSNLRPARWQRSSNSWWTSYKCYLKWTNGLGHRGVGYRTFLHIYKILSWLSLSLSTSSTAQGGGGSFRIGIL